MSIIKKIAIYNLIIFFAISCKKTDEQVLFPSKIFKKLVQPVIPDDVRVFDGRKIQATPLEKTYWVAFDCSVTFWDSYQASIAPKLSEISPSTSILAGDLYPADTGFEGYIDDEYQIYKREDKNGFSVFYVRKLKNRNNKILRIVCYKAET